METDGVVSLAIQSLIKFSVLEIFSFFFSLAEPSTLFVSVSIQQVNNLCLVNSNDNLNKGNRYAYEYFEETKTQEEIREILKNARSRTPQKSWRFEADAREKYEESGDKEESTRYLTDTRYVAKMAQRYLRAIVDCSDCDEVKHVFIQVKGQSLSLTNLLSIENKNSDNKKCIFSKNIKKNHPKALYHIVLLSLKNDQKDVIEASENTVFSEEYLYSDEQQNKIIQKLKEIGFTEEELNSNMFI